MIRRLLACVVLGHDLYVVGRRWSPTGPRHFTLRRCGRCGTYRPAVYR